MAQDKEAIFEKVVETMKTHSKADVAFSMDTHMAADLAIDSVAMYEMIMDIEEQFDIGFSMEESGSLDTVGALVDSIYNKTAS